MTEANAYKGNPTSLRELWFFLCADRHRYHEHGGPGSFVADVLFGEGFRYSFWLRVNQYLRTKSASWFPLRLLAKLVFRHYCYKFGMRINVRAQIGPGLYIGHFGGIFIGGNARVGRSFTISQGVTIGDYLGTPAIGDYVYFGPGAKAFGQIRIGNNVAVGANAVVTKDVPDNAVVVGVPGRVISSKGNIRDPQRMMKIDYETWLRGSGLEGLPVVKAPVVCGDRDRGPGTHGDDAAASPCTVRQPGFNAGKQGEE